MFEEFIRMLFWGVVEVGLFKLGRFYLFVLTLGRLRFDPKGTGTRMLIALFGALVTAFALWALVFAMA